MKLNDKLRFFAMIMASVLLLSSCGNINSETPQDDPTPTQGADSAPPPDTVIDPNVPDNVINTSAKDGDSNKPDVPAVTAPPVEIPENTSADTNPSGEIIDDWKSGLKFPDPGKANELYQSYGIDRTFREGYYRQISSECKFPIIHVSTENKAEILSLDEYVNCFVEVFNCDKIYEMDATSAEIRVRGNASAFYGKKDEIRKNGAPYRIRFTEKQSMLGLNEFARCRSWVLLRTYDTGVKDNLAFELARAINNGDYYSSDSAFVQLYINEKYAGIYLLCEQTQANSERIDIKEAPEDYEGTDIGYLVELDNYATSEDKPYFLLNYNNEKITDVYGTSRVPVKYTYSVRNDLYSDDQLKFIERYFEVMWEISMRAIRDGQYYKFDENYELVPAQEEFASAYDCVNAIIDIDSVVDMYITYEITNDQDLGGGSFYFAADFSPESEYKRLTMVAPWDFDWAYTDYNAKADGGLYAAKFKDSYFVSNYGDRSNPWLILFYSADWFQELVKEKWQQRLPYIEEAVNKVENTVVEYSDDFDKDGVHRASHAKAIVNWTKNRVEYLNTLWGN